MNIEKEQGELASASTATEELHSIDVDRAGMEGTRARPIGSGSGRTETVPEVSPFETQLNALDADARRSEQVGRTSGSVDAYPEVSPFQSELSALEADAMEMSGRGRKSSTGGGDQLSNGPVDGSLLGTTSPVNSSDRGQSSSLEVDVDTAPNEMARPLPSDHVTGSTPARRTRVATDTRTTRTRRTTRSSTPEENNSWLSFPLILHVIVCTIHSVNWLLMFWYVGPKIRSGSRGLEQILIRKIVNNSANDDVDYHISPMSFRSKFYWRSDSPQLKIRFSAEQLDVLGERDLFKWGRILDDFSLVFCVIGLLLTILFDFRIQITRQCKVLFKSGKRFRVVALIQMCILWISCFYAMASIELLSRSALCGPDYIELPFETFESRRGGHSSYGTTAVLHKDIGATCRGGDDFHRAESICISILFGIIFHLFYLATTSPSDGETDQRKKRNVAALSEGQEDKPVPSLILQQSDVNLPSTRTEEENSPRIELL